MFMIRVLTTSTGHVATLAQDAEARLDAKWSFGSLPPCAKAPGTVWRRKA
eukprot:CAMPEP_0195142112 /NCGR_PEP_ID=MMETSP0448-20130528/164053_1 /TAXON_ID=66468 /ORGANISM="Heterocapsa triquestra, Strain CCMP 448" /LENGTH=49 /DNA_ID= /DNA_START= /DNA_END= /DNA_ORIENTATION=